MLRRLRELLGEEWQRTLYIAFFAQLMTAVGFSSIFPFLPLYVKELGSTTGTSLELLAGLVFAGQAFTMMIASPFWGMLADRYGRKLMVQRATFGGAVILLLMAFARSAEELVLLRMIQGIITGTVSALNALVAASAPRERVGYAMGFLQAGLAGGVALGPLIGGAVADAFGYRAAFYVTSSLLFLAGMLVLIGVKERRASRNGRGDESKGVLKLWRDVFASQGVRIAYLMRFLTQLGRMMIIPIMPLFIETLLVTRGGVNTFTGLVIGVASATTTASAIYFGKLGDRLGHRRIVAASALLAALLFALQSFVTAGWQLLLLQALVGAALGGVIPTVSALLAGYTRPGIEGTVYGLDNTIVSGARAVAPLVGSGVALWLGLRATFAATAVVFFLAALLAAWRLPEPPAAPTEDEHLAEPTRVA
jgi:DHA1 family multidrug resistance protein-like MFS transporter